MYPLIKNGINDQNPVQALTWLTIIYFTLKSRGNFSLGKEKKHSAQQTIQLIKAILL